MSLVVLSDQSIEELESMIQDAKFNVVPRIQYNPKFTGFPLPFGKVNYDKLTSRFLSRFWMKTIWNYELFFIHKQGIDWSSL